jgi:hypothetical protein
MKKTPIHLLLDHLPTDGSRIILTKELEEEILDNLKRAMERAHNTHRLVENFLEYLHQNDVITVSYVMNGDDRINFIQRGTNGNKASR